MKTGFEKYSLPGQSLNYLSLFTAAHNGLVHLPSGLGTQNRACKGCCAYARLLIAARSAAAMATKPRAAKTQAHQGNVRVQASITGAGEGVGGLEISGSAAQVGCNRMLCGK